MTTGKLAGHSIIGLASFYPEGLKEGDQVNGVKIGSFVYC